MKHERGYFGLLFRYRIDHTLKQSPEATRKLSESSLGTFKRVDEFCVAEPTPESGVEVPRIWRRLQAVEGQPDVLEGYVASDGRVSHTFLGGFETKQDQWNDGNINQGDAWLEFSRNPFEHFLFLKFPLGGRYDRFSLNRQFEDNHFRVVDGNARSKLLHLEGTYPPSGTLMKVTVDPTLDYLVTEIEITVENGRPYSHYQVLETGRHESQIYPLRGTFHQWPIRDTREQEYGFEVLSVTRRPPDTPWFPEWPPGTGVYDWVKDDVITIAHDPAALRERAIEARSRLLGPATSAPSSQLAWTLGFNAVAVAALLLTVWGWRSWRR